jgi:hypothetical protein
MCLMKSLVAVIGSSSMRAAAPGVATVTLAEASVWILEPAGSLTAVTALGTSEPMRPSGSG